MKGFLIDEWLPVKELSRDAAIEMAYKAVPAYIRHCKELGITKKGKLRDFYDPKIRNLHPWFARRPCSVARVITLASVLPSSFSRQEFMNLIGWNNKGKVCLSENYPPILFYTDPDRRTINEVVSKFLGKKADDIVVCDPMAGGGTIPLESLRLGFRTIAIEYNPLAYIILKCTLEYPAKFGERLAKRLVEESKRLIDYIEREIGNLYPEDTEGYIIARSIRCPKCGGIIPLIHETEIRRSTYIGFNFDANKKKFSVFVSKFPTELPYREGKRNEIKCPYCSKKITRKEAYKIWTQNHVSILEELRRGVFDKEKILSTHGLLIRQTSDGYVACNELDFECFLAACKRLMEHFSELERFMPMESIPEENEVFATLRNYGINRWVELFNPRQLLALSLLTKYIRNRCEELVEREGEFGAAVSLYLSLGLSRLVDYNSIATTWKRGTIRDTIGRYAQNRRITYGEEYCEAIVPYRNLNWIYEPNLSRNKTEGGICPILAELCKRVASLSSKVTVIHGDCRLLSSILKNTQVDVINVDPPYFDQHIYSDISELFWQVVRLSISPIVEKGFIFKDSYVKNWDVESCEVPRKGELIARKSKANRRRDIDSEEKQNVAIKYFSKEWYTRQMTTFFQECFHVLNDQGLLLVWFTHPSMEAWKAILGSIYAGGFYVARVWPIVSELLSRLVTKGGGNILNKTLILVCRKRLKGFDKEDEKIDGYARGFINGLYKVLVDVGTTKHELETFLNAATMCIATSIKPQSSVYDKIQYFQSELVPWSSELANRVLPDLLRRRENFSDKNYSTLDRYT